MVVAGFIKSGSKEYSILDYGLQRYNIYRIRSVSSVWMNSIDYILLNSSDPGAT